MTPKSKALIASAACAVTLVALGVLMHRLNLASATATSTARELAKLKQDVGDLARDSGGPRVVVQVPREDFAAGPALSTASAQPPASDAAKPTAEGEAVDSDERRRRMQVLQRANTELVDDTLTAETIDVQWARGAVERITTFYQGDDFVDVELKAECRSTLCRINVHSKDALKSENALRHIVSKSPWPTTGLAAFNRESQEGIIYISREGSALPKVDEDAMAL